MAGDLQELTERTTIKFPDSQSLEDYKALFSTLVEKGYEIRGNFGGFYNVGPGDVGILGMIIYLLVKLSLLMEH